MKERFLDVIKWGLILIIAGAVFYVIYPKYEFKTFKAKILSYRCNTITGKTEKRSSGKWVEIGRAYMIQKAKSDKAASSSKSESGTYWVDYDDDPAEKAEGE